MNETVNTHKKMEELDKMSIPYEAIPPSEWKRNAYDSNNSVSIETLRIFYKCTRDLEKVIEEQEGRRIYHQSPLTDTDTKTPSHRLP